MSPEIRREQLKTSDRKTVQRVLEERGIEFGGDMGDVDIFYTPKDEPILIVPTVTNPEIVERVFYLEGSEDLVEPLIKEEVVFEQPPSNIRRFPSNPHEKMRAKVKPLRPLQ